MNAMADERLIVMLEARISDFEKRMGQAERRGTRTYQGLRRNSRTATQAMEQDMVRSTGRINQALAATTARIGTFGRAFVGGLAAGAATAAIGVVTTSLRQTVSAIAAVGDEARRSGLGVEEFQQWRFLAEQNRIGVDSLVDGFKELNLRADEFIVTGAGPAAEAFQRIGFSAQDLRERLKDPSELMLEIIQRMERMDNAAQGRIAEEIFGGTAGERFVQLLDQGERGMRRTLDRAREVGAVMSTEMVGTAADLDRRFSELTTSIGGFFKWVAVGTADFALQVANLRNEVEGIQGLRDQRQGASLLGDVAAGALDDNSEAARDHADTVRDLVTLYEQLQGEAQGLAPAIRRLSDELNDVGQPEAAAAVAALAGGIDTLGQRLDAGEVTASDYEREMRDLVTTAQTALEGVEDLDTPTFNRVIDRLAALGQMLGRLTGQANTLRQSLPGAAVATQSESFWDTEESRFSTLGQLAPETSPRPRPAPTEGSPAYRDPEPAGGGGSQEGYAAAAAQIRDRTQALELEAASLVAVAAGGREYGDAIEYARQRAVLMLEAQREGREITPELQAEIDALAEAYVTAGDSAEEAAERMQRVQEASERGIDAATDVFMAFGQGADAGRAAVARLILEIARMQAMRGFQGLAGGGGGGFFSFIGSLLSNGKAEGGYTGDGGTYDPKGIVHGGEYVFSKKATQAIGVARLERMHQSAKGYANGGYVGSSSGAAGVQDVNVSVSIEENGNLQAFVDKRVRSGVQRATPGIVQDAVGATHKSFREVRPR